MDMSATGSSSLTPTGNSQSVPRSRSSSVDSRSGGGGVEGDYPGPVKLGAFAKFKVGALLVLGSGAIVVGGLTCAGVGWTGGGLIGGIGLCLIGAALLGWAKTMHAKEMAEAELANSRGGSGGGGGGGVLSTNNSRRNDNSDFTRIDNSTTTIRTIFIAASSEDQSQGPSPEVQEELSTQLEQAGSLKPENNPLASRYLGWPTAQESGRAQGSATETVEETPLQKALRLKQKLDKLDDQVPASQIESIGPGSGTVTVEPQTTTRVTVGGALSRTI